jgi:non-specific serine/threonine protein kinase
LKLTPQKVPSLQGNLPTPLSSFIGREHELAEVKRLLSDYRMLTLIGSGGSGKTRLAIQVAQDLGAEFPDGIWFVDLAALSDPHLVVHVTASILNVREQADIPVVSSLTVHLRPRAMLLLLDNCEHLIEACARLSKTLLETCPDIRLLTTSREPLGVPGETVWIVPPLTLPEPQPWRSPSSGQGSLSIYEQSEAIRLFVTRASAASPNFKLTPQNAPWVANICRRLDGAPLAIELAAARLRAFSARQIAERLDDRFLLLTGGPRTAPARQQTLEAALDWSYALLSQEEQWVFLQLTVFSSGWTLAAAERVCAGAAQDLMMVLASLVDKSLVVVDRYLDEARYRYLETIRQYGAQLLAEAGETDQVRSRHLDYFTRWTEQADSHLSGPDQSTWLERFNLEHDNLRSALDWSQAAESRAEQGLRLAAACGFFWKIRGYLTEGRARLLAALEWEASRGPALPRARALLRAGNIAYLQSDYPLTRTLLTDALSISRSLGPPGKPELAEALDLLGELATEVGEYKQASAFFEEALAIYRALQDQQGIAGMLMQLGWAAMRTGDYRYASTLLEECLPLFRKLGNARLLGLALAGLGELAVRQGAFDRANTLLKQSLALRQELGDRWGIAASLGSLGWLALLQRDFTRMADLLGNSLAIRLEIGELSGTAWSLEKLAEAASLQARNLPNPHRQRGYQRAACLYGAAQALRQPLNSMIDSADLPEYESTLELLRTGLGRQAFDAAWAEGSAMPLQEIVSLALNPWVTPQDLAALPDAQAAKAKYGGLTPRERQAAYLIAQGKSNREIAGAMFVRVKTVETYITRILNKLGFDSRVQIATWVLEVGLGDGD